MKVYEVLLHEGACAYISPSVDEVITFLETDLENCEVGDVVTITTKEMSDKELSELPEWCGP